MKRSTISELADVRIVLLMEDELRQWYVPAQKLVPELYLPIQDITTPCPETILILEPQVEIRRHFAFCLVILPAEHPYSRIIVALIGI